MSRELKPAGLQTGASLHCLMQPYSLLQSPQRHIPPARGRDASQMQCWGRRMPSLAQPLLLLPQKARGRACGVSSVQRCRKGHGDGGCS